MSMKKTHDLVAVTGTYTNGQGQEKKRYTNVGALFTRDDGSLAIKLESIPIGGTWNGWLSAYLPKESGQQQRSAPAQQPAAAGDFVDDDIPF